MFFLDHAWLVPLIPAVSFVVILLFGKRLPRQGSEVGIVAVGASFVLSVGAVVPVDQPRHDVEGGDGGAVGVQLRSDAASAGWRPRAARWRAGRADHPPRHLVPERRRSSSAPASRSTASP